MSFESIFNTRPKKENKRIFCQRICNHLDKLAYYLSYTDGYQLLNRLFINSKFNLGYDSIIDLLKTADSKYKTIFDLISYSDSSISDEELFFNIEIIINCIIFSPFRLSYNDNSDEGKCLNNLVVALREYLLACGYTFELDNDKKMVKIIPSDLSIDFDKLDDKLKSDVLSYFDFKNADNRVEKKRILKDIIDKLEPRRGEIKTKLGKHIDAAYGSFSNNFDIRHNNITYGDKNYKKTIANLSDDEIAVWYDYIYSFMLNIYLNLDDVVNVNLDNGFI